MSTFKPWAAASAAVLAGSALGQASFTGVGDLPGGLTASAALGISPDGTVVVGWGTSAGGQRAMRWTAGVMTALVDPSGVYTPRAARAAAANGVIVGEAVGPRGVEGFKLNIARAGRFRALGGATPGGTIGGAAYAVSDSGSAVVGSRENPGGFVEACRWYGPSIVGLGYLLPEGGAVSQALGISGDGSIVVGGSDTPDGRRAFVAGFAEMTPLAWSQGDCEARAASLDGRVIVGSGVGPGFEHAVRWTDGVAQDLGAIPGGFNYSVANRCSADGSVVVGHSAGPDGTFACVWRPGVGPAFVKALLLAAGIAGVQGWALNDVTGVSADGTVVVGTGTNPAGQDEGWVAVLPAVAPPCPADFNGDGFTDFFDYDDFVNCFETGTCPAGRTGDFNGDGFADFFDYDDFVGAFEQGC